MSSKLAESLYQPMYVAVERWVDAALRHDDSLFTPGAPGASGILCMHDP
jgi:hypothetical protein